MGWFFKTRQGISSSFKLSNLSKEHFEMVLKDYPDLISKRIRTLTKENIKIVLNINPKIIDNLSISDFVYLANLEYINKEVIDTYLASLKCT